MIAQVDVLLLPMPRALAWSRSPRSCTRIIFALPLVGALYLYAFRSPELYDGADGRPAAGPHESWLGAEVVADVDRTRGAGESASEVLLLGEHHQPPDQVVGDQCLGR